MNKLLVALIFVLFVGQTVQSQVIKEWGVGPELVLNAPIYEPGIGARAHFHFTRHLFIAPQVYYYPGLVNIHELYTGLTGNLKFIPSDNYTAYAAAGGVYNLFFNHETSPSPDAERHNFAFEFGGGITKNKGCLRPFIEYRVNSKWWESNLALGLLFYFQDCNGRGHQVCPAYTMLN